MGIRVIYVMTHDSIGLGEDGPTHQPIEHLWALRAIPNLDVFRPCDAIETAECWELALQSETTPSLLALTRQKLKPSRTSEVGENLCSRGAYDIGPASGKAKVVIFATGSEVEIALAAKAALDKDGASTRVVSVPCVELFDRKSDDYRRAILGDEPVRVAIEAGIRLGWDRFIGADGIFIGMKGFGASGQGEKVFEYFGITAAATVEAVKARLA